MPTTKQAKKYKQRTEDGPSRDDNVITYSDFDKYDAELKAIVEEFVVVGGNIEPINEGINFMQDIAKIMASSENVFPFVRPRTKK